MQIDRAILDKWSAPYRNWHYYPDFVVSASLEKDLNFTMVDGPNVFRHGDEWRMFYFGYDDTGYQSCLATSDDLIHWEPKGLVMSYGKAGAFDYGGVVFVGPLFDSFNMSQSPRLKKWQGKYWVMYGCYPQQGGYELGPGAQGLAWSKDGLKWQRHSADTPVLSIEGAAEWENRVIYSPCIIEHEGKFWNFYNAKGVAGREQIGFATSTDLIHWKRHDGNPVINNNPGGYDALLAANPEIYWDKDHWLMFYFGASRNNPDKKVHAHSLMAFSLDLIHWTVHPEPIFMAGGHPDGLDEIHAHNISLVYNEKNDTHYMFYCAVGKKGRGIGLLTSKSLVE
ncbi:MAG: hypothetical protein MUC94_15530 [bacterium]|nr:hypothetical protein [bacterium]